MILNDYVITYVNKTYVHEHVMYITLCKYYKKGQQQNIELFGKEAMFRP